MFTKEIRYLKIHTVSVCLLDQDKRKKGEIDLLLCDENADTKSADALFNLFLSKERLQKLMDELWLQGYRPNQFKDMFDKLLKKLVD